jgi:hypothetical protein
VTVKSAGQSDGSVTASITATRANGAPANQLRAIRVNGLSNAVLDAAGQTFSVAGAVVTLPAGTTNASIAVRPIAAGQPAMATLSIVDDCGEWPTFVGTGR